MTAEADAYAKSIGFAFQTINRATDRLVGNKEIDELVIAAPGTFLARWLYPRLGELQKVVPGCRLNTVTWNRSISASDRLVDLFINLDSMPEIAGMASLRLVKERFGPVVGANLWQQVPSLERLFDHDLLTPAWPPFMWRNWSFESKVKVPHKTPHKTIIVYGRLLYALQAAEAGLGVAIAPEASVTDALRQGTLIAPFGTQERTGHWYVSWRTDSWNKTKNNVCKWLAREMGKIGSE